jgi:arginase family enzyme
MNSIAVVGVPTSAGAHAPGQERAPEAFRRAGVIDALSARGFGVDDRGDLARVTVCEFNPDHVDEEHALVRTFVERLAGALPKPVTTS